jgi:hypothetical protein
MAKKYLDRNVNQVITWSRNQVKDPTQDWTDLCQSPLPAGVRRAGVGRVRDHRMAEDPESAEEDRRETIRRATRRTPLLRHRQVGACCDRHRETHQRQLPLQRLRPARHDRRVLARVPSLGR